MAQLQRNPSLSKPKVIQHPTHTKHPLHLEESNNSAEFSCDGCHVIGSGTRYHCAICEFDLHDFCATCPSTLSSHIHPNHPLRLQSKVVDDRFCDLCGDLANGLFYSCEECEVDIHPLCTLLPPTAKHSLHPQHILKLQPEKPSWCAVCRQLCNHWRYRCNACCLDIHLECVLDDFSSDSATLALIGQPSQAQPPYRSSDAIVTESTTRALVKQPSLAHPPPGLYDGTSGLTTRRMVGPPMQIPAQPSSGYNNGVPLGGLPMQMNQGLYMNMIQPLMYYQAQGGNQGVFGSQAQGANQGVFGSQGQGGNQVVFGNQLQGGNPAVFGMQGMNYQHIICHQGQGMNQPGSSNNNNDNQGGAGKPKMGVKKKIYLAAKIAASVATLATTGVPLGLFLSSS